jgi:hypothetical protein
LGWGRLRNAWCCLRPGRRGHGWFKSGICAHGDGTSTACHCKRIDFANLALQGCHLLVGNTVSGKE